MLSINPGRLVGRIGAAAAIVLLLNYSHAAYAIFAGLQLGKAPLGWLNIDGESALGSWFSASILLIVAALMLWSSAAERANRQPTATGWLILSIGFVYLSLDEASRIHENLASLTTGLSNVLPIFRHRWVMIGLPAVLAAAALFIPFLRKLPRPTAARLVVAGAVYVGGALGMEMTNGAVLANEGYGTLYILLVCAEETMEVVGTLLAIRAVALHLAEGLQSPALRLGPAEQQSGG